MEASQSQQACPLFRVLPPELRTYIYELVLLAGVAHTSDGLVYLEQRTTIAQLTRQPSVLSLLGTCRLIQHEAVGIFYEKVHLNFHSCSKSFIERDRQFFQTLGQTRLDRVVSLHITKQRINNIAWLCKQLKPLSRLRTLSFFITGHGDDRDLRRRVDGNRIGLLRALARMDQLESVSLSFDGSSGMPSDAHTVSNDAETNLLDSMQDYIDEFVAELNAVIPRNWNAAHPENCVPHALKH